MLWFCSFRPAIAGEGGIGDLLRYWGGEAVYNSHDRHPEMGKVIAIGHPAIVEAEVPISWCGGDRGLGLGLNIGQRFVVARGTPSPKSTQLEDNIKLPLPAELVRRVHVFPAAEFAVGLRELIVAAPDLSAPGRTVSTASDPAGNGRSSRPVVWSDRARPPSPSAAARPPAGCCKARRRDPETSSAW